MIKRNYAKHKEPIAITQFGRTCNNKPHFKPWSEFYKRPGLTGHTATCKECKRLYKNDRDKYYGVGAELFKLKGL